MALDETLVRNQLHALLVGGHAHMDFDEAIANLSVKQINAKTPATPYSVWHIVEHMRIAQKDILDFIRIPGHVSPDYPGGYRPRVDLDADKATWGKIISRFRKDLDTLAEMALDSRTDLFSPIPHAPEYTIFRELMVVADHNAYHIGEIAILRQELGAWPKGQEYLTGEGTAAPDF